MMPPRAIVLNGAGSVGKSSIARAMLAAVPTARAVEMDQFLAALPPESFGTPDGLSFVPGEPAGAPCTAIVAGPLVRAALASMRAEVAAAVRDGHRVIVDEVMLGAGDDAEYRHLLPGGAVAIVAIRAPLPIVEARERRRGDRAPGLARWQFDRVHAGRRYDLDIDSSRATPDENATAILRAFGWTDDA